MRTEFSEKTSLKKLFLDFKKWVKSIQTADYNGARTVFVYVMFVRAVKINLLKNMFVDYRFVKKWVYTIVWKILHT